MEVLKSSSPPDSSHRPRCRELGIAPGIFPAGEYNAITDVPGVLVGHCTLWHGDGPLRTGLGPVRTGVTAVLPHGGNTIREPVEAGCSVFNGAGTTTGLDNLREYGLLETPIVLTNTLSVGTAFDAVVRYVIDSYIPGGPDERGWFFPVVGETYDGVLNDIHGLHVRAGHVLEAIETAVSGLPAEGVAGAGTGTRTCGFKAGIGTSSRIVCLDGRRFTVGALVQSNVPGTLTVDGVPVGRELGVVDQRAGRGADGSIMAVLATDLPLDSRQLGRLAARSALGMARVGVSGDHGSGDFFIAFSTGRRREASCGEGLFFPADTLRDESLLTPVFAAASDAVEEAILDSVFKAVTVTGRDGNTVEALDVQRTVAIMRARGRDVRDP